MTQLQKDEYVIVKNPKSKFDGIIGHVIMQFTSGVLSGKVLVQFRGETCCFVRWELIRLKDLKTPEVKQYVENTVGHGYTECALTRKGPKE